VCTDGGAGGCQRQSPRRPGLHTQRRQGKRRKGKEDQGAERGGIPLGVSPEGLSLSRKPKLPVQITCVALAFAAQMLMDDSWPCTSARTRIRHRPPRGSYTWPRGISLFLAGLVEA